MVYHGKIWESMGNFSKLLTVLGLFYKNKISICAKLCLYCITEKLKKSKNFQCLLFKIFIKQQSTCNHVLKCYSRQR